MSRELPEEEFGPNVAFREHSLLENPRANIVDTDVLTVHVCQVGMRNAHISTGELNFLACMRLLWHLCCALIKLLLTLRCAGRRSSLEGAAQCPRKGRGSPGSAVALEAGLDRAGLVKALAPYSAQRILRFADTRHALSLSGKERER